MATEMPLLSVRVLLVQEEWHDRLVSGRHQGFLCFLCFLAFYAAEIDFAADCFTTVVKPFLVAVTWTETDLPT